MSITEKILEVLSRHQPCSLAEIQNRLPNELAGAVARHMRLLSKQRRIVNHGIRNMGRWAIAGTAIESEPSKAKKEPVPIPAPGSITPGRLIGNMDGVWLPAKQFTRPEGSDHLRHPSRRGDDLVLHIGPISMVTSKIKSPGSRSPSDLRRVAKKAAA